MNNTLEIELNGKTYKAQYEVFDDDLVVYLPDGTTRETWLRGLIPKSAARTHLVSYAIDEQRQNTTKLIRSKT